MPGRPEVAATNGDTPVVEHRVSGGVVRLSATASYVLGPPTASANSAVTVLLDNGLVWANVNGGSQLEIRHGPTVLRTSGAEMLVDASAGGDVLVVVIAGEVEVATPTLPARRLVAGAAGQLTPSGAITEVDGITEPELAADPWAQANRRLDADQFFNAAPTNVEADVEPAASVAGDAKPEAPPEEAEPPASPEASSDQVEDAPAPQASSAPEPAVEQYAAPSPARHDRRRLEVAGLLGLAFLILVAALAFVLTRDESSANKSTDTSGQRASSTTKAPPTSTVKTSAVPTTATPKPTVRSGRAQLTSCRQTVPGQVRIAGRAWDPSRKARAYGVRVTLVSPAGSRLARADQLIAAQPRGAFTSWVLPVAVPRKYAGIAANCRITGIDAID